MPDVRQLIHTPAELATEHLEWARYNVENPGMTWGIPTIDKRVIPMRPGDLIGIMGRPGHGKSSIMSVLNRTEAERIMDRGQEMEEAVVSVTWESSAEELENFHVADDEVSASDVAWGRADLDHLTRKAAKRARVPIWVIGHGIGRAARDTPRMTVEAVYEAIESMEADYNVKPTLVTLDYVQIIPIEKTAKRTIQVTEAVIRAKELAQRVGVPVVMGVQASRKVDNYTLPIPEKADAQWASSIEQTVDKLFALWRPIVSPDFKDTLIEVEGVPTTLPVTEDLLIMRMLKQRGENGRWTWALHFEPQYLTLSGMELRDYEGGY